MTIIAVLLVLVILWIIGSWLYARSLEQPTYTVISENADYEVRYYPSMLLAQTTVPAGKDATNRGFSKVAGYIFGDNTTATGESAEIAMTTPVLDTTEASQSQAIAMTSPVLDTESNGEQTIAFVLPSKWTLETLPTPNDPSVQIIQTEPQRYAAMRYSELRFRGGSDAAIDQLRVHLQRDGITIVGEPTLASYDPPLTPFFLRLNEVLIPIQNPQADLQ